MRKSQTPASAVVTELILEVFKLNGRLLVAGDRLVAPLGLTSARWQVLGAVALSPTPQPVARLARNMGLNRQGVQRIVDEMHAEGWFAFAPNPHHRRAKLVVLTNEGAALYAKASGLQIPWANALARGFARNEIEAATHVLAALHARLAETAEEIPMIPVARRLRAS